jgi:two-component system, sensor histidine kinase and response regulator
MNLPVNLLLVDDEPRNLDVLETMLQNPEYRLVRAGDADEALKALITTEFAAIVLDVRMPGTSGLELAQLIKQRKKTQHIPIIFLTAYYQEDEHVMQGYSAGAVDYLSKPCNPDILRSKVAVFAELFRKGRALEAEIAERRQAEQRIRDLNDQLAQRIGELASANTELEAFSYSVSHDLRAPLRQVVGFVGRLTKPRSEELDPKAAAEYLPLIRHAVTRMGRLIDDLLEFSRVGRTELLSENVSLQGLLDQTLQSLQSDVAGRSIHWKVDPLPEVHGDPAMLRQVLANLIDNAVKFTRPRESAEIAIGCTPAEHEYVVCVRDNGVGFDPRYAHKLFGVFQRLHSAAEFEGTGIGLASVRRIIERHGGRTWAESALGQGSTFCFSLPR